MEEQEPAVATPPVTDRHNNTAFADKTKEVHKNSLSESLELLEKAIKNLHHEVGFASNAFVGSVNGALGCESNFISKSLKESLSAVF